MEPLPGTPQPPAPLAARFSAWRRELAYQYDAGSVTYRFTHPKGEVRYLKLLPPGQYPGLAAEAERTRWARRHLPVPEVLESGSDGELTWLITRGLPGRDATHAVWAADRPRLVAALGRGLRAFHQTPIEACPFDAGNEWALAHVRDRAERGVIDPSTDFHDEFAHLSIPAALARLEALRPTEDHLVVCHGDWCPPNILLEDWKVTGYLDLGEVGVADRWCDLAVGSWSVGWNYGSEYEPAFFEAYGVEPDHSRIEFYRLRYDLTS